MGPQILWMIYIPGTFGSAQYSIAYLCYSNRISQRIVIHICLRIHVTWTLFNFYYAPDLPSKVEGVVMRNVQLACLCIIPHEWHLKWKPVCSYYVFVLYNLLLIGIRVRTGCIHFTVVHSYVSVKLLVPGTSGCDFKYVIFNPVIKIGIFTYSHDKLAMSSDECDGTLLTVGQNWCR